ncbi:MAG: DNA polymerase-1 [Chlamydiales bacterium]|jgi:DNA polymerase-1
MSPNNRITAITAKKEVIPKMERKKQEIFTNIENILDYSKAWSSQGKSKRAPARPPKQPISTNIEKRNIYKIFEKERDTLTLVEGLIKTRYVTNKETANQAFKEIESCEGTLSLDIETYPKLGGSGLDPFTSEIRLIQIYVGGESVYVFDLHNISLESFPASLWKRPIVCHNALFELKHLLHRGIELDQVGCTMIMGYLLQGYSRGGNLSLKGLAKEHLGIEISKEEQRSDWSQKTLSQKQIDYAAADAVITHQLFLKLRQEVCNRGLLEIYTIRKGAQKALARTMLNGVFFNIKSHDVLISGWEKKELQYRENLTKILGNIKLGSQKQLNVWLNKNIDQKTLLKWSKTANGLFSVSSKVICRFKDSISWYEDYAQYKKYNKKITTYGKKMQRHIHSSTGRMQPDFLLAGTDTGRLSSRNPNIQQFPRDPEFRELFEAPKGKVLIVADYSQIELRVAAIVSKDKVMMEAYEKGEDLHKKTAAALLDIQEKDVTKEQRQRAKAVNFGFLFGQGARGFVDYAKDDYGVDVTLEEAVESKNKFLETYPDLKRWQMRTRSDAKRALKVKTPSGFVRRFKEAKHTYNQSLNTPIQGGAAEVLLKALALVDNSLDHSQAKIVNCIHDEIILESCESYKEEASTILETSMITAFSAVFPTQTTKNLIETKSASNWRNAK